MRNNTTFALVASRFFAVCAIVAGVAAGFLEATFLAGFACFDSCPPPARYFSQLFPTLAQLLLPCVGLALLALGIFLAYCAARGQRRRAIIQAIVFLAGGLVGVSVLGGLLLLAQAKLPVNADGLYVEQPLETWAQIWGLAIMVIAAVWTGTLARLSWAAE